MSHNFKNDQGQILGQQKCLLNPILPALLLVSLHARARLGVVDVDVGDVVDRVAALQRKVRVSGLRNLDGGGLGGGGGGVVQGGCAQTRGSPGMLDGFW